MSVSALIVEARHRGGLTQGELAQRSGTSQATLSRYESGDAVPTISTLERIIAATGATLTLAAVPASRVADVRSARMSKLRQNKKQILAILKKHNARNPQVFGSVARGDDGPNSDIDLLVDVDMHKQDLFDVFHIELELEELLGEKVEITPRSIIDPQIHKHAIEEAVPL